MIRLPDRDDFHRFLTNRKWRKKISLDALMQRFNSFHERVVAKWGQRKNPEKEGRWVIFTMGVPGSGKSTVIEERYKHDPQYRIIDTDLIKEVCLVGYDPLHPELVHKASQEVAMQKYEEALLSTRPHVVFETTGTNTSRVIMLMKRAREQGFKVKLLYVSVPLDVAIQRALGRERQVKIEIIEDKAREILAAFDRLATEADEVEVKDNSARRNPDPIPLPDPYNPSEVEKALIYLMYSGGKKHRKSYDDEEAFGKALKATGLDVDVSEVIKLYMSDGDFLLGRKGSENVSVTGNMTDIEESLLLDIATRAIPVGSAGWIEKLQRLVERHEGKFRLTSRGKVMFDAIKGRSSDTESISVSIGAIFSQVFTTTDVKEIDWFLSHVDVEEGDEGAGIGMLLGVTLVGWDRRENDLLFIYTKRGQEGAVKRVLATLHENPHYQMLTEVMKWRLVMEFFKDRGGQFVTLAGSIVDHISMHMEAKGSAIRPVGSRTHLAKTKMDILAFAKSHVDVRQALIDVVGKGWLIAVSSVNGEGFAITPIGWQAIGGKSQEKTGLLATPLTEMEKRMLWILEALAESGVELWVNFQILWDRVKELSGTKSENELSWIGSVLDEMKIKGRGWVGVKEIPTKIDSVLLTVAGHQELERLRRAKEGRVAEDIKTELQRLKKTFSYPIIITSSIGEEKFENTRFLPELFNWVNAHLDDKKVRFQRAGYVAGEGILLGMIPIGYVFAERFHVLTRNEKEQAAVKRVLEDVYREVSGGQSN